MEDSYRPLTDWQRRLIERLLATPFPGRDVLLAQLQDAVCTSFTDEGRPLENGGLFFRTASVTNAPVKSGVPAEGEAPDADGVIIHYLLHVYEGKIGGLEIFKEDFSRVLRHAEPEELEIMVAMTRNQRLHVRRRP